MVMRTKEKDYKAGKGDARGHGILKFLEWQGRLP